MCPCLYVTRDLFYFLSCNNYLERRCNYLEKGRLYQILDKTTCHQLLCLGRVLVAGYNPYEGLPSTLDPGLLEKMYNMPEAPE
jgi:hypothetical protein